MSIDPDEFKVRRIKRDNQIQDVQNYLDEQDALEKQSKTGKMGSREVKKETSFTEKFGKTIGEVFSFLRRK